jgi:hypothetical protein
MARRHGAVIFATGLHAALALYYRYWGGLSITIDPERNTWDWFWQAAPLDLLRERLLETVFYFHAQPPLYNIVGGLLAKLFYPHHLEALYTLNIVMGALMVLMAGLILRDLVPWRPLRLLVLFFVALHPSLFIYGAYILYDQMTAFLVLTCIFCVWLYTRQPCIRWLVAFTLALNLLILTRSLFHPVMLVVALPVLGLWVRPGQRRRAVAGSALVSSITVLFLVKNLVVFGFFGLSSWGGMSLYRVAVQHSYNEQELAALIGEGVIAPMMIERAFEVPSVYAPYSYTEESSIPVLNNDDRNNINYIAISREYGAAAMTLTRREPTRYAAVVIGSYLMYVHPSSRYMYTELHAEQLGAHVRLYEAVLGATLPVGGWNLPLMFFITGLVMAIPALRGLSRLGVWPRRWLVFLRDHPLQITIYGFVLYGLLAGVLLEIGENHRFKYVTEVPFVLLTGLILCRALRRFWRR